MAAALRYPASKCSGPGPPIAGLGGVPAADGLTTQGLYDDNFTYDAAGNQLSVRDPNNVGQNVVCDALGRASLTTDTASATTNSSYDKSGNRIAAIDGKTKSTTYTFDNAGVTEPMRK